MQELTLKKCEKINLFEFMILLIQPILFKNKELYENVYSDSGKMP